MTREGREETRRFGRSDGGKTGDATTHHEGYEPGQEPPAEQPQLQHGQQEQEQAPVQHGEEARHGASGLYLSGAPPQAPVCWIWKWTSARFKRVPNQSFFTGYSLFLTV